jgi:hypothetical protein
VVSVRQPATFFNIKVDDRVSPEPFASRFRRRVGSVGFSFARGIRAGLELLGCAPAIQHQKSEVEFAQDFAFALPGVGRFLWRRTDPVSRKRKRLPQDRKRRIPRIDILVETQIGICRFRLSVAIRRCLGIWHHHNQQSH